MLFATASRAESGFLVDSVSCSGTSTQSFLDVLSFNCAGDLSLYGGSISANTSILLSATGALSLNNLTLTSQDISLISGTLASAWSGVDIHATNSINISIPDIAEGTSYHPVKLVGGIINDDSLIAHGEFFLINPGDAVLINHVGNINVASSGTLTINQPVQAQGGSIFLFNSNGVLFTSTDIQDQALIATGMQLYSSANFTLVSSVPEPNSCALLLLGVLLVILASRSKVASPQRMIF